VTGNAGFEGMKKKSLICVLFIALIGSAIVIQQLAYPPAWDEVEVGMSRKEVYERTGLPTRGNDDIKGSFWFRNKPFQVQELWINFDQDRVKDFYISEHLGTNEHFVTRSIRSSWAERGKVE
jgi:hypothetical protein